MNSWKKQTKLIVKYQHLSTLNLNAIHRAGGIAFGEEEMSLLDFPDLMVLISSYFSDKIIELEKQLEEL